ncbi:MULTISPECIES: YitT family protein [Hydrotalea]|uniref:YitT family protein n=1 Tax=Hydrotalea TaxID=1004300 RepID=UPI0009450302|nr:MULTISPECIES: YitT family protein [Hydrotalea]RWZ90226.1 MAG: YitT family protein [Hydrotalea sp. AMD]
MNPLWSQFIYHQILKKKSFFINKDDSSYKKAKGFRFFKLLFFRLIKDVALMLGGIFSAAFGLKGFLLPNKFIDGGVTGISLLMAALTHLPIYVYIILINIPFILMAFKVINRAFAIKTTFAITGLAMCLAFIQFPVITKDHLLVAVFGGFFLGAGIGLSVRGGAVIDGTEILAIFLSKKLRTTIGDIIVVINVIIFCAAAYLLSIEAAMYSLITYLAASKTLDFIVEGIDEYIGVTIISPYHETIRQMIIHKMGRGVTVYNGKRGFGKNGETKEVDIIYTVVTRLELNKLSAEIERVDSNAFVVMSSVKDTKGGMIKKRGL